jgi:hypothetical protein
MKSPFEHQKRAFGVFSARAAAAATVDARPPGRLGIAGGLALLRIGRVRVEEHMQLHHAAVMAAMAVVLPHEVVLMAAHMSGHESRLVGRVKQHRRPAQLNVTQCQADGRTALLLADAQATGQARSR